ncbi:hypothetical protein QL285_020686 [Trifolium repens]|nr:hypothetical protein QL285_020686 [Trifolium repens]
MFGTGFVIFDSVTKTGRISEVEVLKMFVGSREMSFCNQSSLLKFINQVSSFMSGVCTVKLAAASNYAPQRASVDVCITRQGECYRFVST